MDESSDSVGGGEKARLLVERADDDPTAVRDEASALLADVSDDELSEVQAIYAWALGLALRHLRSLSSAREWLERSLRFLPMGGDDHTSVALTLTGVMAFTGDLREAEKVLEELSPSVELAGRVEFQRAAVAERLGEIDRAAIGYEGALQQFRAVGDSLGEAHALNGLGLIALDRNQATGAAQCFGLARLIYIDLELGMLASVARNNLGLAVMRAGDLVTAVDLLESAADELSAMGEPFVETALDHVEALLLLGRPGEASKRAQVALTELQVKGVSTDRAELLLALGMALHSNDDKVTADRAFDVAEQIFKAQERPGWVATADLRRLDATGDPANLPNVLAAGTALRALGMDNAAADADVLAVDLNGHQPDTDIEACLDRLLQLGDDDLRKVYAEAVSAINTSKHEQACELSRVAIATAGNRLTSTTSLDVRIAVAAQRDKITSVGLRAARLANNPNFVVEVLDTSQRLALRPLGAATPAEALSPQIRAALKNLDQVELWRQLPDELSGPSSDSGPVEQRKAVESVLAPYELLTMFDDGQTITCTQTVNGQSTFIDTPPRQQLVESLTRHATVLSETLKRQGRQDDQLIEQSATAIRALLPWLDGDHDLLLAPTGALFGVPWTSLTSRPVRIIADLAPGQDPGSHTSAIIGPGLVSGSEEVHRIIDVLGDHGTLVSGNPENVLSEAAGGTLHLCCHGHHDINNPLLSSYELAGGSLSGLDITNTRAVPALVVAAACRSGAATVIGQTSTLGLPTAWIAAGTSVVIAPTCPIPDDQRTVDTMVELHRALTAGESPERAVQLARSHGHPTVARSLVVVGRLPMIPSPHQDDRD